MTEGRSTVTTGQVEMADLVQDEHARAEALKSFLSGNPFGAPSRQDQVGYTSQNPDDMINRPEPPTLEQEIATAEKALQDLVNPSQPSVDWEGEARGWMKKFGDRENDFGELRRKNAELEETVNLILAQQNAQPQQPQYNQYNPVPQQNFSLPMQSLPNPGPMFGNKAKDDYVTVAEAETATEAKFAPFFGMMAQHAQYLEGQIQGLRKQGFDQAIQGAGIDNITSIRLKAKYPSLNAMADGPDKINLMRSLASMEQRPSAAEAQPQPMPSQTVQNIVRRATLTESSRGASGEPAADPNAMRTAEMAAAQALPFHLRAIAMEKVMRKYGVPTVNTFASGRFRV